MTLPPSIQNFQTPYFFGRAQVCWTPSLTICSPTPWSTAGRRPAARERIGISRGWSPGWHLRHRLPQRGSTTHTVYLLIHFQENKQSLSHLDNFLRESHVASRVWWPLLNSEQSPGLFCLQGHLVVHLMGPASLLQWLLAKSHLDDMHISWRETLRLPQQGKPVRHPHRSALGGDVLQGLHGGLVVHRYHVGPQVGLVEHDHEQGKDGPHKDGPLAGHPALEPGQRVRLGELAHAI